VTSANNPNPAARVAVGRPGRGLAGFRRSHLAALDARRVATWSRPTPEVTRYDDVALLALLTTEQERARWFVTEQLGPLAADDRVTADLRRTLLNYLDNGGSLVRSAAELHIHRNTVVYRLRRAEELLGRAATDGTLDLHAALRLADTSPGPHHLPRG
jgi:DNA-binding PucR family transcriptional regulator